MSSPLLTARTHPAPVTALTWRVEPFLHWSLSGLYNPLTDRSLRPGEPATSRAPRARREAARELEGELRGARRRGGWLIADAGRPLQSFYLKYVSLEAHTVCNQACYFCPVSIAPRETYFMPTELYERVVGAARGLRVDDRRRVHDPLQRADRRQALRRAGAPSAPPVCPPAVLTNGTGLTPAACRRDLELGGLRFLSINLSTLDRERYDASAAAIT